MKLKACENLALIREWANDERFFQFFRAFPAVWSMKDSDLVSFLSTTYEIHAEGKCRGLIALSNIDPISRRADLGIMVTPGEDRQALAIGACRFIGQHVFENMGFNKIACRFVADRVDIERLLTHAGFKHEAYLRQNIFFHGKYHDEKVMSLLASEYNEKR